MAANDLLQTVKDSLPKQVDGYCKFFGCEAPKHIASDDTGIYYVCNYCHNHDEEYSYMLIECGGGWKCPDCGNLLTDN